MTNIIKSHGFKFAVEGSGFIASNAMDDFETACDNLSRALDALDASKVAELHAGAVFDPETGECVSNAAFQELSDIADQAASTATAGWFNPSEAFITVSAAL